MFIFPKPQTYKQFKRQISLDNLHWVKAPDLSSDNLYKHLVILCNQIKKHTKHKAQLSKTNLNTNQLINFKIDTNIKISEYFKLTLSNKGFNIIASDEAGIFYASQIVLQILNNHNDNLYQTEIEDYPDLKHRGIMLDVSRDKVPKINTLKKLIDSLAIMRINQLQLYIEHSFAFSQHQTVWLKSSPFTHQEIIELDIYCRERFITLVPNLNSFGHLERWLKHKKYAHLALQPSGFIDPWQNYRPVGSTLKPNQASLNFVDELYQEFLPNFTSTLFNVGCDETFELKSTEVYLKHLKGIYCLVKKHKKQMMFWGDIILKRPDLIKDIPKDCIALDWGYEAQSPFNKTTATFKKSGINFYVCPGTSSWNSITGRSDNCIANIKNAAKNAIRNNALGFLNTDWGDHGHHQNLPISYLGFTVGAGCSWCLKNNHKNNWAIIIDTIFYKNAKLNLADLWIKLGQTILLAPNSINNNKTFINQLLFEDDTKKIITENQLTKVQINNCLKHLKTISKCLKNITPTSSEATISKQELNLSISIAKYALNKAISTIKHNRALHNMPNEIKTEYKTIWLKRNRIGGLKDSLLRLK